mgnify:CR=1 FL=1
MCCFLNVPDFFSDLSDDLFDDLFDDFSDFDFNFDLSNSFTPPFRYVSCFLLAWNITNKMGNQILV